MLRLHLGLPLGQTLQMHFLHQKPSTTRQISYQEWQYTSVSGELEMLLFPESTAFGK